MEQAVASFKPALVEILLTALVLGWRVLAVPLRSLWRDWPVVLAVYGLVCLIGDRSRPRPLATTVAAAYLVGLYVAGQFPLDLRALGIG